MVGVVTESMPLAMPGDTGTALAGASGALVVDTSYLLQAAIKRQIADIVKIVFLIMLLVLLVSFYVKCIKLFCSGP